MASFNKFQQFVEDVGVGVHNLATAGDTVKVYLTNTLPVATNTIKANITEITAQNGYPSGGSDIQQDYTQTSGTATLTGVDVTWTASGGSFGPFQYVVMYNDTPTSPADPLIGWWDYGSAVTVNTGESFTVDFGASVLTLV
jgi:hypothetical protein